MKTSKQGIDFIKLHENFEPNAYIDPVGILTIGYGHVIRSFEQDLRTKTLTEQEATQLLMDDLTSRENTVKTLVKVPINQNKFDALVSLVFNIGSGAFKNSTVLRLINQNATKESISNAWKLWNKGTVGGVKITLPGLVTRRKDEVDMYFGEYTSPTKKKS